MRKEVRIKISGFQTPVQSDDMFYTDDRVNAETFKDMQESPVELSTTGVLYSKDGVNILKYDEYFEDAEAPVKNLLRFDANGMELTKKGGLNAVMSFGGDKWVKALYETPYGPLQINIMTRDYNMDISDDSGRIDLDYLMDFGNECIFMCNLIIDIKM